ncbi:MAG TPA: phosphomannose isomerase type II C-terminal cupin domain [Candidatus Paceibacterota bacterium]|nr:phosphomannose isomerase type II C-terminal cupin domain [Candidatus Paceibacterota bacterium]
MDAPHPYEEDRPWGSFRRFTDNELSTVKILTVRGGEAFSLQTHAHRSEFWRILSGECDVTVGDAATTGKPGDEFFVPQGAAHRIAGIAPKTQVLEIAYGTFDENDITRLEDKYGRPATPGA